MLPAPTAFNTSCVDQRMDQYLDCTPGTWTHQSDAVKEKRK